MILLDNIFLYVYNYFPGFKNFINYLKNIL